MDRRHHIFGLVLGSALVAGSAQGSILPDNNLYLQDCLDCEAGITEAQFNQVIAKARTLYTEVIRGLGGTLNIRGNWGDSTVNASASQLFGTWQVNMYGGLARRPEVTVDGFTLVLCHELGHHLAGMPYVSSWGADEGQSDYFATNHCAQLFWQDDVAGNEAARATIHEIPKSRCDAIWGTEAEQNLCYRAMLGGKSLADLLGALGGTTANWNTPDTREVTTTDHAHPAAQCRLDTYMAGAVCVADYDRDVIPGKRNGRGYNDRQAEEDAARFACTAQGQHSDGLRPRCWFKPTL